MSKADLKDIKHKIITFEPKVLEGKISNDPQKKDEVKPVRPPYLEIRELFLFYFIVYCCSVCPEFGLYVRDTKLTVEMFYMAVCTHYCGTFSSGKNCELKRHGCICIETYPNESIVCIPEKAMALQSNSVLSS